MIQRVSKDYALDMLRAALDQLSSIEEVGERSLTFDAWRQVTRANLHRIFGEDSREYAEFQSIRFEPGVSIIDREGRWREVSKAAFQGGLLAARSLLTSFVEAVERTWNEGRSPPGGVSTAPAVFVSHAYDDDVGLAVERFLYSLGVGTVRPVDLLEGGHTTLRTLEEHSDVAFAVFVMPDREEHSRSNVLFELGFMTARMGRNRVAAIVPSTRLLPWYAADLVVIPYDPEGMWRYPLARELRSAGLEVNLNAMEG